LGDFFMSEGNFDAYAVWIGSIAMRPFKKEPGQAFGCRMRKPQGADLLVCGLAIAAQMLGSLEASVPMDLQKTKEIIAFNEVQLTWLSGFSGNFIWCSGDGSVQTEDFTWLSDLENQGFTVGRSSRKFNAPLAEHVDAAWGLALNEKNRTCRIGSGKFYFFKSFEGRFGKSAEKTIAPQLTNEAIFNEF
jgi:hypothetical protein